MAFIVFLHIVYMGIFRTCKADIDGNSLITLLKV